VATHVSDDRAVGQAFRRLDEAIDAALAGQPRHRSGTIFVGEGTAGVDSARRRGRREGKDVVVVRLDGSERVEPARRWSDRDRLVLLGAVALAGLVVYAAARSRASVTGSGLRSAA
jgi:hypothetical protein